MKNVLIALIVLISCQQKDSFLDKIDLTNLDGTSMSKDELDDKIVILNLWATWCDPCIREMPDLVNMQSVFPDNFILILASGEELEKIRDFTKKRPFDLTCVQIQTSTESLGVHSLPTTFLIGRNGELLETLVGVRKWDSPKQINNLEKHLK